MTLLRDWAHKAQKQGLEDLMIQQILRVEAFEEAALEVVSKNAGNPMHGESGADIAETQVTDLGYPLL